MQPTFYAEGTTQERVDTKGRVLKKWLGALQNSGGVDPANNPARTDTKRQTEQKILKSKQ